MVGKKKGTGGDHYDQQAMKDIGLYVLLDSNWDDPLFRDQVRQHLGRKCPKNLLKFVPLYPTPAEIYPTLMNPPLRSNKVQGCYHNVYTYLDIQFKLLREDLTNGLRNGLSEYASAKRQGFKIKDKIKGVWLYEKVKIGRRCADSLSSFKAQFDVDRIGPIKWEYSKRLIYGSLLCLSSNDFKSFCFATVATFDRNVENLKKGLFELEFITESMPKGFKYEDPNTTFVMLESVVYFEAYKHCLSTLQKLTPDKFPFKESIISLKTTALNCDHLWDLSVVVDTDNQAIRDKYSKVDFAHWPPSHLVGMDDSQYQAFRSAFQHSLALIQGPPGTGKTYVGLKIVQTLHHNRIPPIEVKYRHQMYGHLAKPKPIVIMCYTNHALDQFLEGILRFCRSLVRIGGRSRSEALEEYKLSTIKEKNKLNPYIVIDYNKEQTIEKLRKQMIAIHRDIRVLDNAMSNCNKDLLDLNQLIALKASLKKDPENKDQLLIDSIVIESDRITDWFRSDWFEKQLMSLRDNYSNDLNLALIKWITDCDYTVTKNKKHKKAVIPSKSENKWKVLEMEADIQEVNRIIEERIVDKDIALELDDIEVEVNNTIFQSSKDLGPISAKVVSHLRDLLATKLSSNDVMDSKSAKKISDITQLSYVDRWRLYRLWLQIYRDVKNICFGALFKGFAKLAENLRVIDAQDTYELIKDRDIIGMTITGAAKCKYLLNKIDPKIIVIEEAAEVLESYVVTALTENTEHLILIGDHKQLKPTPAVFKLAEKHKFDVSLFERLVNNGMPYKQLKLQHRMRPEISKLLVPHIYKVLNDHQSVKQYESIRGMDKNIFFFNHSQPEDNNEERMSKYNIFEAKFIVRLVKHLLYQGYKRSQITVLSMYSSQLVEIRELLDSDPIFKSEDRDDRLRATSVDNYQGEENDIILVSFVRSNKNNEIGFLKVPNRVNVALSRAKKGLYCIGNFDCLSRSRSQLWINITNYLEKTKIIGNKLQLRCGQHNQTFGVKCAEDFDRLSPYGGCGANMSHKLDCEGKHSCPLKKCHSNDDFVKCSLMVTKSLDCGHSVEDLCSADTVCDKRCERRLGCGHKCDKKCCEECQTRCKVLVKRTIEGCNHKIELMCHQEFNSSVCFGSVTKKFDDCGHSIKVKCCDRERQMCDKKCDKLLVCGHQCRGSCNTCAQSRLHIQCKERCPKKLICGHQCNGICGEVCPPCDQICENSCSHEKCFHTCSQCCIKCVKPCQRKCLHQSCSKKCGEECDPCLMSCQKKLKCKHNCIGLCGEKCPNFCLICNKKRINDTLIVKNKFLENNSTPNSIRFVELDCKHIIEDNVLLSILLDPTNQDLFKQCPKCQTMITHCPPFQTMIAKQFSQLAQKNRKLYCLDMTNSNKQEELVATLQEIFKFIHSNFKNANKPNVSTSAINSINEFNNNFDINECIGQPLNDLVMDLINATAIDNSVGSLNTKVLSKYQLNIIENKVIVAKSVTEILRLMQKNMDSMREWKSLSSEFTSKLMPKYYKRMARLLVFIRQHYVNADQQIVDAQNELNFLGVLANLLRFATPHYKPDSVGKLFNKLDQYLKSGVFTDQLVVAISGSVREYCGEDIDCRCDTTIKLIANDLITVLN